MAELKVIEVNKSIFAANDEVAKQVRKQLFQQQTYMINFMASPGAGKTTLLLKTIDYLRLQYQIGVMEADIEADVDAQKMIKSGVKSIQVHTAGECAMNANMTKQALDEFDTTPLDMLFLENVGNLVCPAEEDTGAMLNVAILSVPEGDDKPLKYPLMFKVCDAIIISKIDTKNYFPFDDDAIVERIHYLNPHAKVFFLSAKTDVGMEQWIQYIHQQFEEFKKQ